jgi:hypothetical protein
MSAMNVKPGPMMLVCENHPDKAWPDECECGAGMALKDNPEFANARVFEHDGRVYIIRDVWSDGGNVCRKGLNFLHCQYAVVREDILEWRACGEGVMFADIEPYHDLRMNATNG